MQVFKEEDEKPYTFVGDDGDQELDIKVLNDDDENFNTRRRRGSVSFFEAVCVRETMHLYDMTEEEIDNTWYTYEEMNAIKRTLIKELKFLVGLGKQRSNDDDYSFRGLENRLERGNRERRANKWNACVAVLDEQLNQKISGMKDTEAIRNVYLMETIHCTTKALNLGKIDAIVASNIYNKLKGKENNNSTLNMMKNEEISFSSNNKHECTKQIKVPGIKEKVILNLFKRNSTRRRQ